MTSVIYNTLNSTSNDDDQNAFKFYRVQIKYSKVFEESLVNILQL